MRTVRITMIRKTNFILPNYSLLRLVKLTSPIYYMALQQTFKKHNLPLKSLEKRYWYLITFNQRQKYAPFVVYSRQNKLHLIRMPSFMFLIPINFVPIWSDWKAVYSLLLAAENASCIIELKCIININVLLTSVHAQHFQASTKFH